MKLRLLFLQALDLLLEEISFLSMLSVGLVKLVPLIKTLIKPLGDHGILLSKKLLVIQSLVQSTRLQERPIGNVLRKEEDISVTKLLDTRKYSS